MIKSIISLIILVLFSCSHYPTGVENTLSIAGINRSELEIVLRHYAEKPEDSLKYKAACYLIDNMKWHLSTVQVSFPDSSIFEWYKRVNYLYDVATKELTDSMLTITNIKARVRSNSVTTRHLLEAQLLDTLNIDKGIFPDPKYISSEFLISHIENAFQVWESSPFASQLSFDQFKELILPYRAISGYSFYEEGKKLNDMFGKCLHKSTEGTLKGHIERYIDYSMFLRLVFYIIPQKEHVGLFDMMLGQKADCISMCNNACNIFRANGLPTTVDCNTSYREKSGRHYHCKLIDTTGTCEFYNTMINLDTLSPLGMASSSFLRHTFGAQKDSPYMLKAENETLPDYFDTPCIRDVTSEYYPVTSVSLPFNKDIPNQLAYLYAFSNSPKGIAPATWGLIDNENKQVKFKNTVYYVLYFPVFLKGDSIVPFGSPFYVIPDDAPNDSYYIVQAPPKQAEKKGSLLLHRKYPEKPYLKERARRMVGGRFEGANQLDFSDAVLLCTIQDTPLLNIQELTPLVVRPFQYYRYIAPKKYPESHISVLEFLTDEFTSEDSLQTASPVPIYNLNDTKNIKKQNYYMKLRPNLKQYPSLRYEQAFNTSMQSSSYSNIVLLPLEHPITVKKIRFAPANAENHIVVGHTYQLMYWDNGWKNAGTRFARYNFLQFDNVPLDCLYWLRDLTTGKEELPFFYRHGKQLFIYHDTIVTPASLIKK